MQDIIQHQPSLCDWIEPVEASGQYQIPTQTFRLEQRPSWYV